MPASDLERLIREIAAEKWPGGYEHIRTAQIVRDVGQVLAERGVRVPGRDVFLRALGRRKG